MGVNHMNIAIFGATGRTGIPLVQQALDKGHKVVAFLRDPAKMPIKHERLSLLQGDIQNAQKVEEAVKGVDAVLMVLGHTKSSSKDILSTAAQTVVDAMKKQGVKRLVTLTGAGVRYPEKDEPKLFDRVMGFLLKRMAGDLLADSTQHVEIVRNSGLDWTIVRVPVLTEAAHTAKIKVGYVGKGISARIGRADVADFILRVLEQRSHLYDLPVISN
jgi:putative NADH-flavin reductase